MADPLYLLLKAREALSLIATWPREREGDAVGARMRAAASDALEELRQRGAPPAYTPWMPYLVDRADGVKGHYCIGRSDLRGTHYYWNAKLKDWASCCDSVMSLEQALVVLKSMQPTLRIDVDGLSKPL